jgi:hypothetical protein
MGYCREHFKITIIQGNHPLSCQKENLAVPGTEYRVPNLIFILIVFGEKKNIFGWKIC